MLKVDYSLLIQIANFLLLLFLLNRILYRPIRRILVERAEQMNTYEGTIADLQQRSEQDAESLEQNMKAARKEGFDRKEGLRGEGLEEEKGMLQKASAAAGERIDEAKADIGRHVEDVRRTLEKEIGAFSQELAEKILGRSIS
jgi:F-type H+-transporting ATPase subunit b